MSKLVPPDVTPGFPTFFKLGRSLGNSRHESMDFMPHFRMVYLSLLSCYLYSFDPPSRGTNSTSYPFLYFCTGNELDLSSCYETTGQVCGQTTTNARDIAIECDGELFSIVVMSCVCVCVQSCKWSQE